MSATQTTLLVGQCRAKPQSRNIIETPEILEHLKAKLHIITRFTTEELDLLSLEFGGLLSLRTISVLPCGVPVLPEFGWDVRARTDA